MNFYGIKNRIIIRSLFLFILLALPPFFFAIPLPHCVRTCTAASRVQVYDREELKEALREEGRMTVELMETVTVRQTLKVKGTKILTGPGELRRAVAAHSAFGGSLLRVTGGSCTLRNITLDGRGETDVLKGELYGYLVQVDGGQLNIGNGAVLKNNRNTTRLSDGGGAVRVGSGGSAVLNGGTIIDNVCVTGGAGIRVDSGGAFSMKSGTIRNNRVVGRSVEAGFDGRGGGIYNRGTTGLYGGSITGNTVSGAVKSGREYGGVGGGVANAGSLLIEGTYLRGNSGVKGSDLGLISGDTAASGAVDVGECWLRSGCVLQVGKGFSVKGKLRLITEKVRKGTKLVSGLQGKGWKNWFTFSAAVRSNGLEPVLTDGSLCLRTKLIPTPSPTPRPTETPVEHGGTNGGSGGSSGGSEDDESGVPLVVPAKTTAPMPTAPMPTVVPTPSPTPVKTPYPRRPSKALPYFYLYPPANRAGTPAEIGVPVEWHFTARQIQVLKDELKEGALTSSELLSRISGNRRIE